MEIRTAPTLTGDWVTARTVLEEVRDLRSVRDRAEARLLAAAVAWAEMHVTQDLDRACVFADTPLPVAGPGAPLVAASAVAEYAAAMGLPTETGKHLLGQAVELAHRLPGVYARVLGGDLPAWRARRITEATIPLSLAAAAHVDGEVAGVAHRIRPAELDRVVAAAIARFMPAEAEARRQAAADGRYVTVEHEQVSYTGTSRVHGELDLADALDLQAALAAGAAQLKAFGSTEVLAVRRSVALGELARRELALAVAVDQQTGEITQTPRRPVGLTVHLSELALAGCTCGAAVLARCEQGSPLVTTEQARRWCQHAEVTLRPVIDLDGHHSTTRYEAPPVLREQTVLLDPACVFPWCTRPARACDHDHVQPADAGGPTCSCNQAPLCRFHHRLKTHTAWSYDLLGPGTYLWSAPTAWPCGATTPAPPRSTDEPADPDPTQHRWGHNHARGNPMPRMCRSYARERGRFGFR